MNDDRKKLIRLILTAALVGGLGFFVLGSLLQPVFTGRINLPQSFGVGIFRIQFYGLCLGLAAMAGYWLALRRREKYDIPSEFADNIIFIALVGGFIGARLYHILSEASFYFDYPSQIIAIWNGGLSIFGAALGAVLAIYLYYKYVLQPANKFNFSFATLLDWLVPSIVVGQIIGRFGNFFNYELYGYPTNLIWKMFVPVQFRLPPYELNHFFHPLFLYEIAGCAVILVLLLKLNLRGGRLFLMWLLLYNVMRFFLEFLRIDSVFYGNIRINAIVAFVLVVVASSLLYKFKTTLNDHPSSSNS